MLIPFANILRVESFKIGERILVQGEHAVRFCIVAKGAASVIYERKVTRTTERSNKIKGFMKRPKNFVFSKEKEKEVSPRDLELQRVQEIQEKKAEKISIPWSRTFEHDLGPSDNPFFQSYTKHVGFRLV